MLLRFFSIACLIIFFYSCETPVKNIKRNDELLIGSWKMVADQQLNIAGEISSQDKNVAGLLVYTPERKMSVQILWQGTRSKIMTDTIMKHDGISYGIGLGSNTWNIEQSRTIIDSYESYFGDYSIDWENHVVAHTITGNLRPEEAGTVHRRRFQLRGDSLFLRSTDPEMKWQVAWVRDKK